MEITGDELLDMMFLPLTDDRVINTLDALGMEQPVIDEQYEMDREAAAGDDEGTGLTLPYGLSFNDS